jgi:hypothetical protein
MHSIIKRRDRQVIRVCVPYGDEYIFAAALVVWGRQAPHVALDSPRYWDPPALTTIKRLTFESPEGTRVHPGKNDYRALRNYVLTRAGEMRGGVAWQ